MIKMLKNNLKKIANYNLAQVKMLKKVENNQKKHHQNNKQSQQEKVIQNKIRRIWKMIKVKQNLIQNKKEKFSKALQRKVIKRINLLKKVFKIF